MAGAVSAAAPKPNIIHIFADDLGKASLGIYSQNARAQAGLPHIKTPNLDAMSAAGLSFNKAYAATLCSPSRGMLYLGFNQAHNANDRNTVNPRAQDITLAQVVKQANYNTSVFGKWGFGGSGGTSTSGIKTEDLRLNPSVSDSNAVPTTHGYDEFTGYINHSRAHRFYTSSLWTTDPTGNPQTAGLSEMMLGNVGPGNTNLKNTYTHDVIAAETEQYIEDHYQSADPFFMQVNYTIPHNDLEAIQFQSGWFDDYAGVDTSTWTDKEKFYAAMITRMDASIGSLMDKLEDPNGDGDKSDSIMDETMIVFTSDNGATDADFSMAGLNHFGIMDDLRGGKRDLWEGGIQMPQFVRWDGVVTPGTETDHQTDLTDFMATIADLAGVQAPVGIDGHSLAPLITGSGIQRKRDYLVFEHHEGDGPDLNGLNARWAIIRGDYKLIEFSNNEQRLYNLATDPNENNQLNQSTPANAAIVAELTSLALAEGVEQSASYDHQYAAWTGGDGDSINGSGNWNLAQSPEPTWSTTVNNTTGADEAALVTANVDTLGFEVQGDNGKQTVRVGRTLMLTGRNEVRIDAGGRVQLDDGELESWRWTDVLAGGELTGHGDVQGDVYNQGVIAPGLPSDLSAPPAPPAPPTPPVGVVTVVDFNFSGIQDGVANNFTGSTTGQALTQTNTLSTAVTLTGGFDFGPGVSPKHGAKPGNTDVGDEYNVAGTNGESSLAGAISGDNYMTYTVTPLDGLEMDVEDISFRLWRNGTGAADDYAILTSIGGFTAGSELGTLNFAGGGIGIGNQQVFSVTDTGDNYASGPIEVRLYGWNNGGTGGNFHVNQASLTGKFRTVQGTGDSLVALDPTGLLNLNGDFWHIAGGAIELELGGDDNSDLLDPQFDAIAVTGVATLEGSLMVSLVAEDAVLFDPILGDTFDILTAAGGVVGQFSALTLPSLAAGLAWEVLYSTNAVTLEVVSALLPGDYNGDGMVDGSDYAVWRNSLGQTGVGLPADGDGSEAIDAGDLQVWIDNFGATSGPGLANAAVPEPASLGLVVSMAVGLFGGLPGRGRRA